MCVCVCVCVCFLVGVSQSAPYPRCDHELPRAIHQLGGQVETYKPSPRCVSVRCRLLGGDKISPPGRAPQARQADHRSLNQYLYIDVPHPIAPHAAHPEASGRPGVRRGFPHYSHRPRFRWIPVVSVPLQGGAKSFPTKLLQYLFQPE